MADCSCDFCGHDNKCPYAYNESDCYVETIKASKAIVDDDFKAFLAKLEKINEDMCDDNIRILIGTMRKMVNCSEKTLPAWATKKASICEAVLLSPDYGRKDDCSLCVHEHENFGDNVHCKKCKNEGENKEESL